MGNKSCPRCGTTKNTVEFGKDKSRPGGLYSYCKICAAARQYKYRPEPTPGSTGAERVEMARARSTRWARAHRDKYAAWAIADRAANPEKYASRAAAWQKANPDKVNASTARRRATKLQATPVWASKQKIDEFYYTADMLGMHTGDPYHVDHVVPLRSKLVCGLHCEFNLQVLTGLDNLKKGNRCWPGMPSERTQA